VIEDPAFKRFVNFDGPLDRVFAVLDHRHRHVT
jgi:hypothetical protein